MRRITRAPGAFSAILTSSASESAANCRTPTAWAWAMSAARLIVLPKAMWLGRHAERAAEVDLAARGRVEMRAFGGERGHHLGGRVRLDRIVDRGVAEAGLERAVLGAQHREVEHHRRAVELMGADVRVLTRADRGGLGVGIGKDGGRPGGRSRSTLVISIRPGGVRPRRFQKRRYRRYLSSRSSRARAEVRALASGGRIWDPRLAIAKKISVECRIYFCGAACRGNALKFRNVNTMNGGDNVNFGRGEARFAARAATVRQMPGRAFSVRRRAGGTVMQGCGLRPPRAPWRCRA